MAHVAYFTFIKLDIQDGASSTFGGIVPYGRDYRKS